MKNDLDLMNIIKNNTGNYDGKNKKAESFLRSVFIIYSIT